MQDLALDVDGMSDIYDTNSIYDDSDEENWGEEYGGGGFNPSLLSPGATSVAGPSNRSLFSFA